MTRLPPTVAKLLPHLPEHCQREICSHYETNPPQKRGPKSAIPDEVRRYVVGMKDAGFSFEQIARGLDALVKPPKGERWAKGTVYWIYKRERPSAGAPGETP